MGIFKYYHKVECYFRIYRINIRWIRARIEPTFVGSVRLYFEERGSVRFDFILKNMV